MNQIEKKAKAEIRTAVADLVCAAGCSCCRDDEAWDEAKERLGKILGVKKYEDGSGRDFYRYRSKKT